MEKRTFRNCRFYSSGDVLFTDMKAIIKVENLSRCKNFTLNVGRGSNIKYKPYVFTERGLYMWLKIMAYLNMPQLLQLC